MTTQADQNRCPVCGIGELMDLSFDAASGGGRPAQGADSRQLEVFTCGHEVTGPSLATADEEALDVERRSSQDTVEPLEREDGKDDDA
jgi:hypothetical protein